MTTQGRYGGYQVVPGFKLPPMIFSDEEALALAVGLMAARGLGLAQSMPAVASARAKLERVFPVKLKQRLRAVDESIALELARPAAVIDQQVLGLLCTATQEHRRVRMAYQSRGEAQTEREFDPYGLVYRAGRWYIVGWCHLRRGLRSFRLDRVASASSLTDALRTSGGIRRARLSEAVDRHDPARAQRRGAAGHRPGDRAEANWCATWACSNGRGDGVLLRAQADDLDWIARELARLPFDFSVKSPVGAARGVAARPRSGSTRLAGAPRSPTTSCSRL